MGILEKGDLEREENVITVVRMEDWKEEKI